MCLLRCIHLVFDFILAVAFLFLMLPLLMLLCSYHCWWCFKHLRNNSQQIFSCFRTRDQFDHTEPHFFVSGVRVFRHCNICMLVFHPGKKSPLFLYVCFFSALIFSPSLVIEMFFRSNWRLILQSSAFSTASA